MWGAVDYDAVCGMLLLRARRKSGYVNTAGAGGVLSEPFAALPSQLREESSSYTVASTVAFSPRWMFGFLISPDGGVRFYAQSDAAMNYYGVNLTSVAVPWPISQIAR